MEIVLLKHIVHCVATSMVTHLERWSRCKGEVICAHLLVKYLFFFLS